LPFSIAVLVTAPVVCTPAHVLESIGDVDSPAFRFGS
jgi:hypothetical protein